ncbi:MAG: hypothetical protein A3D28_00290 [Omnitrophica bacterium RIFCSPHIGHO2_02_FULL_63_14]|nr:MAG: hypothetical protein A3D28_00290 [Omnitrophica bacterium RIFCSPHIGHO2_02_FULL_63_14]
MRWSSEQRENAKRFSAALKRAGFDFFTGVPCSLLGALIEDLDGKKAYFPAVREDAAIGMAAGAWLAGRRPAVLMQNSGLGYSLNVLTSLNLIYRIPVLCVISYRGLGPDAPEHLVMGKSCEALLETIGVESTVPEAADMERSLAWAESRLKNKMPAVIFIKKGIFGT